MKNIFLITILFALAALAGCTGYGASARQASATDDIKACQIDSDCAAVPKGCCQCDGLQAVNTTHSTRVRAEVQAACGDTMCTMQYCFNEIIPKCIENKCTEKLKIYPERLTE